MQVKNGVVDEDKPEVSTSEKEETYVEEVVVEESEEEQGEPAMNEVNECLDKKALLLVSFGTSYADTRAKTIEVPKQLWRLLSRNTNRSGLLHPRSSSTYSSNGMGLKWIM